MRLFSRKKKSEMKDYPNEYTKEHKRLRREITEIIKEAPNFTMEQISEMDKKFPTHFQDKDVKNPEEHKFRVLALSYSMGGNLEECIACCDKGLEINPQSAYLLYMRGRTFSDLRQFENGINDLSSAVKLREDFADAWYEIGRIHHMNNDMDSAILAYYNAKQFEPNYYKIDDSDPNDESFQGSPPKITQTLNEKGVNIVMEFIEKHSKEINCHISDYFAVCAVQKLLPEYLTIPKNIQLVVCCSSVQIVREWWKKLSQTLIDNGISAQFKENNNSLEVDTFHESTGEWAPAVVMSGEK